MRSVILVTPGNSLKNDLHLKLLYRVLKKNGFLVFPLTLKNLFRYNEKAIWHIHWIDIFHRGTYHKLGFHRPIIIISFIRVCIFIFFIAIMKIMNVKIIWSIHNASSHEHSDTIFEKIVSILLLRLSDRVTAFNQYIKKSIITLFGFDKITIMKQGLYENCYPEVINKLKARKRYGIMSNKFVLLHFGKLLPYKGVDILIKALSYYDDDDLVFICAGNSFENQAYGRYLRLLSKGDKRIIFFDRYIQEEEIPYLFGAADFTIHPYRKISNSGILFLSLTFGLPIIISDKGGVREVTDLLPDFNILIKELTIDYIIDAIKKAKSKVYDATTIEIIKDIFGWKNLESTILNVFRF